MNTTCEFCGANLSRQVGFDPSLDLWACRRCGYENGSQSSGSAANDLNFGDFDFDDFLNPRAKTAAPVKTTVPVSAPAPKAPVRPAQMEEPKDDYYEEEEDEDEDEYDSYSRYSSDFDDEDDYYEEDSSAGTIVKNIFLILVMLYSVFTIVHQLCPGLFSF